MKSRHTLFPLLAVLSATACTVTLPAAQAPLTGTQPVFVSSGPAGKNPIIQSFTANPTNVTKGQPITFQVVAHDPNDETLQYNWSSTGGTLSATTGQALMWTPPETPGVYTVMVTVTNGRGGIVTGNQNLTVQADGAAAIGGKTDAASAAPAPVPSPAPSALLTPLPASASVTLTPAPTTTATPTAAASIASSPDDSQCPLPDYYSYNIGLRLGRYTKDDLRWVDAVPNPSPSITSKYTYSLRVKSASNSTYVVNRARLQPNGGTSFFSLEVPADGLYTAVAPDAGVYVFQFTTKKLPWDASETAHALLGDCNDTTLRLFPGAVKFQRANWQAPADAPASLKPYDGTMYFCQLSGQTEYLGTFELP